MNELDADVHSGRALHLIDVENLAGGPAVSAEVARAAIEDHLRRAGAAHGDLIRVAANPWLYERLAFDLPAGWQVRFGHGPDGADRALLDGLDVGWIARRFDRLVIGSGDHGFADLALQARALGCDVWVLSARRSLSGALARSASRVVPIHRPEILDLRDPDLPARDVADSPVGERR